MKDIALKIIDDLKKYDSLYVIGHNNTDADSYFSSYILSVILKSFGLILSAFAYIAKKL